MIFVGVVLIIMVVWSVLFISHIHVDKSEARNEAKEPTIVSIGDIMVPNGASVVKYTRFYDQRLNVVCWLANDVALSCIPIGQLSLNAVDSLFLNDEANY